VVDTREQISADVMVIGAGLAGLVAARELGRAGLDVVVLEARDRLGGRAWYADTAVGEVELGGGWVHWLQPYTWTELRRYGIGLQDEKPLDVVYAHFDGRRRNVSVVGLEDWLRRAMQPVEEAARKAFPRPYDPLHDAAALAPFDRMTLPEGLNHVGVGPDDLELLTSYWAGNVSGPAADGAFTNVLRWVALAGWDAGLIDQAAGTFGIEGGTRRLVEAIAGDVRARIELGARVVRLEHSFSGIVVGLEDRRIADARAGIVTCPWGALRHIVFEPPLKGAQAEVAVAGCASRGLKVWVRIADAGERWLGITEADRVFSHVAVDRVERDSRVLVCFGGDAAAFDPSPDAVAEALRIWDPEAVVLDVAYHDWTADPLTGETWLTTRPHQLTTAYPAFREPIGTLVFAGSDYADGWAGFMDGAIESGGRAARVVEQLLAR
jgi:monoamine oxidase